jgi:putative two-component system response regulator
MNRSAARAQITATMKREKDLQHDALIMIDLENFKEANATYGHQFGDEVLQYIADTLRGSVRGSDIVARLGGDEFLVFVDCSEAPQIPAQRIFERISRDYNDYVPGVCMGIAMARPEDDFEALFHRADVALCSLKSEHKSGYRFYDDVPKDQCIALDAQAAERETQMKQAEEAAC